MASIIKKKIKGHLYYYYAESKRVDGKPKLVNQKYLGTAEKLLGLALLAEKPINEHVLYSNEAEFGAVMIVYDIAKRLGIVELIDSIVPKRKQGVSVGMYILTAAINRATCPSSKNGLEDWFSSTCLPSVTGFSPSSFTPQNFWNNTGISADDIDRAEESILRRMLAYHDIDTTHIIYDATNFFTYIDTMNGSELPKRGRCKAKRNDLRIVGLSMMVSPDFSIPLLSSTYPGNRPDAKEFARIMERLKARYESITDKAADVTVVFDRGNNSEDNLDFLESGDFKLHFVGGLKKNQAKKLFEVDRSDYKPMAGSSLEGQSAFRSKMEVFGRSMTVVIVHNPELENGQLQGILINREKTLAKLAEVQQNLERRSTGEIKRGKRPTVESVANSVEKILASEYMKDIIDYEISEKDGHIGLTFEFSHDKLEGLRSGVLGKTALFTDRDDFTTEQIIVAYRSAWKIEAAFKQLKDPDHLTVRPIFHWTDEKIRVHIFSCVLAYRLCCLLIKELFDRGIRITINRLIDEMSQVKRIHTFFGDLKKPQKVESFTRGSETAMEIETIYKLKEQYS